MQRPSYWKLPEESSVRSGFFPSHREFLSAAEQTGANPETLEFRTRYRPGPIPQRNLLRPRPASALTGPDLSQGSRGIHPTRQLSGHLRASSPEATSKSMQPDPLRARLSAG